MKKSKWKSVYFNFESTIVAVMYAFMLIILTLQVILRFVFNSGLVWAEELARYLFIWVVYLSSATSVLERREIRIDALEKVFPGVSREISAIVGDILQLAFTAILMVLAFKYTFGTVMAKQMISVGLGGQMWPWWLAVPVGMVFIIIRGVIKFIEEHITHRLLVERDKDSIEMDDVDKILEEVGE